MVTTGQTALQTDRSRRSNVFGTVALAFTAVIVASVGCSSSNDCLGRNCRASEDGPIDGADGGPTAPACTVFGKPHIGLGGKDLAATFNSGAHVDRARAKPYSALVTEYSRVLGTRNKPTLIDQMGGTFGQPPARWYIEPFASAVFVNTAYNVAFEGCLRLTGDIPGGTADPRFATPPTPDAAKAVCNEWIRTFWSRDGAPDQIDACTSVALESKTETYGGGSIPESTRPVSPKRQWAYACASVLTASGFLMY